MYSFPKNGKFRERIAKDKNDGETLGPGAYNSIKAQNGVKKGNVFSREDRFRVKLSDGPGYYHDIKRGFPDVPPYVKAIGWDGKEIKKEKSRYDEVKLLNRSVV